MILAVVTKPWFSKSPWDSYTKKFETEQEFLKWYTSLSPESFTRKEAQVSVYSAEIINDHYSEIVF